MLNLLTNKKLNLKYLSASIFAISLISGCSTISRYGVTPSSKLVAQKTEQGENQQKNSKSANEKALDQRFQMTPTVGFNDIAHSINDGGDIVLEGDPVSLNVDSLPLPTFINEVFGNILKQSYVIAPALLKKNDLVTLRLAEPISRTDLYYTTKQLLETYGVAMLTKGQILRFVIARGGQTGEAPLFVTGQALPNVPVTHRPIFQVIPLKVVRANNAVGWLMNAFKGQPITISADPYRNAIWLQGKADEVKQAVEVLKVLDQPLMRGRHSLRIEPMFLGANKLVARLIEVLKSEGYDATQDKTGTINFLPIDETNSIIVFATAKSSIEHVKKWVIELDRPLKQTSADNIFYYTVKNTSAQSLSEVINRVSGGIAKLGVKEKKNNNRPNTGAGERLIIDEARNSILFQGNAEQWAALLPIIKKMDVPDIQVLVEVIVAEVNLSEDFAFGIEWAINNASLTGGLEDVARNALTIGQGGLSYFPISNSGSTRAVLNALAGNRNVKLLQTPKILVRSGSEASINVGDEVPIVTSQSTLSGQQVGGTSALTQNVQYRSTGNSLSIKPVVYAGGQVNMTISQELSSASLTDTSSLNSPTILNRSINTSFSVKDGGSVLIGGLIQTEDSDGETRVPFLSDIPFVGKLFTQKKIVSSRTELMVLVIPYVVRSQNDAEAITRAFQNSLELHKE